MSNLADSGQAVWVLLDLDGNLVQATMTERVDGAFWLVDGQEIPAPRIGSWPARQAVYRQHGYQLAEVKNGKTRIL